MTTNKQTIEKMRQEVLSLGPQLDRRIEGLRLNIKTKVLRGELSLPPRIARALALRPGSDPMS